MNAIKTALLLGLMSGILLLMGQLIGGQTGMLIGLAFAVVMNFASYFFSEKIALSMYSAQPVTPQENPEVYARMYPMVQNLTHRMGLPMPKLWVIPDDSPNAFATGRNPSHSSLAFTDGLLRIMNDRELEGVIAHELGHVLHRDILTSSVAATIGAAISQLAWMGMWFGGGRREDDEDGHPIAGLLMVILAPFVSMLIQMAVSRTREYSADAAAAKYTGSPDGLIGGLRKLERGVQVVPMDANPATAHMFIMNPLTGSGIANWFSTHPPVAKRIERLAALRGSPVA
jgi:heat shock protein HtpX